MEGTNIEDKLNRVYNSDARKIIDFLSPSIRVGTTITSPPYFDMKDYGSENQIGYGQTYEEYLEDIGNVFKNVYDITDEDGSLWIVIDTFKRDNQVVTLPFDLSNKLKEVGWLLQDIIIWKKDKTVPWSTKGFMQRKFEYVLFLSKSQNFKYNKDRVRNFDTNQLKKWWVKYPERYNPRGKALDEIWEFPIPTQGSWGDQYIRHFCPLPKEMVATMIEISTNQNDLVLDPFAGSGSVLFQSAVMGRKFIGFELNKEYINMFENYFKEMYSKAAREYEKLSSDNSQSFFEDRILDLRALKYGRLLVNHLEKEYELNNLKIFVEVIEYLKNENHKLIKIAYQIISSHFDNTIISVLEEIISKPPFSKFGINPVFSIISTKEIDNTQYFGYTRSNSYAYSLLPLDSDKIKIVSEICVNLNEDDYN